MCTLSLTESHTDACWQLRGTYCRVCLLFAVQCSCLSTTHITKNSNYWWAKLPLAIKGWEISGLHDLLVSKDIRVCVCVCVRVCVFECMSVRARVCLRSCLCKFVCVSLQVYMRVHVHVGICSVHVCMYVHQRWQRFRGGLFEPIETGIRNKGHFIFNYDNKSNPCYTEIYSRIPSGWTAEIS